VNVDRSVDAEVREFWRIGVSAAGGYKGTADDAGGDGDRFQENRFILFGVSVEICSAVGIWRVPDTESAQN
jgi:hypothetical protein